jgi:predicted transcriptional regulator
MGRIPQQTPTERILGRGVALQWRIIDDLLERDKPVQQSELAKSVGTTETTVSRVMKTLTKDEKWKEVFKTDKIYQGRVYWIEKDDPLSERLSELRDLLSEINELKGQSNEGVEKQKRQR